MLKHVAALLLVVTAASVASAADAREWTSRHISPLMDLYQHLHATPELSFMEEKTAARMAQELRAVGAEVATGVGGHGVVGLLKNGPGPTLLIRTDLDGLPITEQTGLPFASTVKIKTREGIESGAMHGCAHDIHMTCWVATARFLAANKDQWSGTVMFVAQPAEERGMGAMAMLKDGLYERFGRPDFAIAMHNDPTIPLGKVGCRPGAFTSNADSVDITLLGRGGHGAQPQDTVDPVVMAAQLVMELQTIVSRERRATETAIITVGSLHAGTKHNIISDRAELQLTVRSYSDEMRKHLHDAIRRKTLAVAKSARAPEPTISVHEGTGSIINSDELTTRLVKTFKQSLGEDNVLEILPATWSEDFSYFRAKGVPIMMFRLGTISEGRRAAMANPVSLHSPFYYPDAEETIITGTTAFISATLDLLRK